MVLQKQKTSQELATQNTVREANVEGGYSDLRQCLEWLCEVKLLAKSLGFVSGPTRMGSARRMGSQWDLGI